MHYAAKVIGGFQRIRATQSPLFKVTFLPLKKNELALVMAVANIVPEIPQHSHR